MGSKFLYLGVGFFALLLLVFGTIFLYRFLPVPEDTPADFEEDRLPLCNDLDDLACEGYSRQYIQQMHDKLLRVVERNVDVLVEENFYEETSRTLIYKLYNLNSDTLNSAIETYLASFTNLTEAGYLVVFFDESLFPNLDLTVNDVVVPFSQLTDSYELVYDCMSIEEYVSSLNTDADLTAFYENAPESVESPLNTLIENFNSQDGRQKIIYLNRNADLFYVSKYLGCYGADENAVLDEYKSFLGSDDLEDAFYSYNAFPSYLYFGSLIGYNDDVITNFVLDHDGLFNVDYGDSPRYLPENIELLIYLDGVLSD